MRRNSLSYDAVLLRRARNLRRQPSVGEHWLWSQIRRNQLGFSFRRQVPVLGFVIDFYCTEAAIAIELDGEQHDERLELDSYRDTALLKRGIFTIRIPSLDLFDSSRPECGRWPARIKWICEQRTGRPGFAIDEMMKREAGWGAEVPRREKSKN